MLYGKWRGSNPSQIPGMHLWFYSNDHTPPHFHAKRRGQWELRVNFQERGQAMLEVKWRKSSTTPISAADRKTLRQMVEKHRYDILKEWEQKVSHRES